MIKNILFAGVVFFFIIGCAKPDVSSRSAIVTFMAKGIKVHDTAFVATDGKETSIQVYSAGNLVLDITSASMVCINSLCLSDDEFCSKYLSEHYPKRLINTIVSKKRLNMDGIETIEYPGGFEQSIYEREKYDIRYSVKKDEVFFKDSMNRIVIKIKDIN